MGHMLAHRVSLAEMPTVSSRVVVLKPAQQRLSGRALLRAVADSEGFSNTCLARVADQRVLSFSAKIDEDDEVPMYCLWVLVVCWTPLDFRPEHLGTSRLTTSHVIPCVPKGIHIGPSA